MVEVERRGPVVVIRMDDGENRFNRDSVGALHRALDEAEATEGPLALVTSGTGKFFSNGLDLDWMGANPEAAGPMLSDVHRLFGRLLGFPALTVAAVNGHAFAGGAMLAAAHDFTIMREDRGYWCLPEADLGLTLTPSMLAVITARLPRAAAHEAILTGRRYAAREALALGIVHQVAAHGEVLDRAVDLATSLAGKARNVTADHKQALYGDAIATCLAG